MALELLAARCTITVCHSRTKDLAEKARGADVLVAAVGRPRFVPGDWVKEGALVIDVGINRLEDGSLVGDLDYDAVPGAGRLDHTGPGGRRPHDHRKPAGKHPAGGPIARRGQRLTTTPGEPSSDQRQSVTRPEAEAADRLCPG